MRTSTAAAASDTSRRFVTAALDLQRDQLVRLKAEAPQPR